MPRIGIIAPYQEMYLQAITAVGDDINIEIKLGLLNGAIDVAKDLIKQGAEILISRGGTSNYLKKEFKSIPVVDIEISSYDIANAILKAKNVDKYIALVVFKNMIYGEIDLSKLFDANIGLYYIDKEEQAEKTVVRALADGYRVILGGKIATKICSQMGVYSVLINSGSDSIIRAVKQAYSILITRDEILKELKLFQDVINNTSLGIIAANSSGVITMANKKALRLLNKNSEQVIGSLITEFFPEEIKNETVNLVCKFDNNSVVVEKSSPHIDSLNIASIVTLEEVSKFREKDDNIRSFYRYVERGYRAKYVFSDIKGKSKIMHDTIKIAQKYALAESTILIEGETGTGKEMFAQSIHNNSKRYKCPFVAVNCSALPESLLESELFGYAEGAFTGAVRHGKPGLFEIANMGTIFLDEISEIPINTQAKLLRVLQEKEIMRIGDDKVIPIDVRVIAATNKKLKDWVAREKFRADLFYRLSVLKLKIPPLRERVEDIEILFDIFLSFYCSQLKKDVPIVENECYKLLRQYKWPGNVRELQNFVEQLIVSNDAKIISPCMIYEILGDEETNIKDNRYDPEIIMEKLKENNYNKTKTARDLCISRTTLWKILKENKTYC